MFDKLKKAFMYQYEDNSGTKVFMTQDQFDSLVNEKVAEKLSTTKKKFQEFIIFDEMTPFQKVISFIDTRAKYLQVLLASYSYFAQESVKPGYDVLTKADFKKRLSANMSNISTQENMSSALYYDTLLNLYGVYLQSRNLSKEKVVLELINKELLNYKPEETIKTESTSDKKEAPSEAKDLESLERELIAKAIERTSSRIKEKRRFHAKAK